MRTIDETGTDLEVENKAIQTNESGPQLPANLRPAVEETEGLLTPEEAYRRKHHDRPVLWLGTVDRPKPYAVETVGKLVRRMVYKAIENSGFNSMTYVSWLRIPDPENFTGSATAEIPDEMMPINELAIMCVGAVTPGAYSGTPGMGSRLPYVWTTLTPLTWDGMALRAKRVEAARCLITPRGCGPRPMDPILFEDAETAEVGWIWAALTGLRILTNIHIQNLESVQPTIPDFFCRTEVLTDDGQMVEGWAPPNHLVIAHSAAANGGTPPPMVKFRRRGVDQLLSGGWVDVNNAPPWGIVDRSMGSPSGAAYPILIQDGDVTLEVLP